MPPRRADPPHARAGLLPQSSRARRYRWSLRCRLQGMTRSAAARAAVAMPAPVNEQPFLGFLDQRDDATYVPQRHKGGPRSRSAASRVGRVPEFAIGVRHPTVVVRRPLQRRAGTSRGITGLCTFTGLDWREAAQAAGARCGRPLLAWRWRGASTRRGGSAQPPRRGRQLPCGPRRAIRFRSAGWQAQRPAEKRTYALAARSGSATAQER